VPAGGYPLAGYRLDLPDGSIVHSLDIGPGVQSYLKGHQVYGRIVVAGSFHCSLLLAVAESHWPGQPIELRNIQFVRAISFEHPSDRITLCVQLTPVGGGGSGFLATIASRNADTWTTHATGVIDSLASSDLSPRAPLKQPANDAACEALSPLDCIELLRSVHIDWGPDWCWLREITYVPERTALGRLDVPDGVPAADSPLPPGLSDSAFGLGSMAIRLPGMDLHGTLRTLRGDNIARVPFAVERIVWYGRRATPLWTEHVVLNDPTSEADSLPANVTFWDADGTAVAHTSRASRPAARRRTGSFPTRRSAISIPSRGHSRPRRRRRPAARGRSSVRMPWD
jgi:hypothetical protein